MTEVNDPRTLDPSRLDSWIQIRADNTVSFRTGVADFGQGTVGTVFRQLVAEELRMPVESVEMVTGDTDRTHDGGISAGFMSWHIQHQKFDSVGTHPDSPFGFQGLNAQKAAAYTYAELLRRASDALGAPTCELTVEEGIFRSGASKISYAQLVKDRPLDIRLDVTEMGTHGVIILGAPPVVPVAEYRVVGTSTPNPRVPAVVSATAQWVGDVRLPEMLHARMVHPRTLGSTLVSVGSLHQDQHPSAEIIVLGNLVGVVAPNEWDAIRAAAALAETTVWTECASLPGNGALIESLMEADWVAGPIAASPSEIRAAEAAIERSDRTLTAYYMLPYYKHAPISPEITVADARKDGTVHLWACTQRPQGLRIKIATMLGIDPEDVVVHFAEGTSGFGRTTQGDAGTEAEAVLLSLACGKPVRLQWTREEDFAWSAQQTAYFGEVTVALNDTGRLVALKADHHQAGERNDPLLGALLAGLPSLPANYMPDYLNSLHYDWQYDRVEHHFERAMGAPALGKGTSPIGLGLRHRSMRSPQHLQQNFAIESMLNEVAAAAGVDPIQYRLEHTSDRRLIGVLEAVRELSGWQTRPSPGKALDGDVLRGRGVGVAIRGGSYNAAVAEILVNVHDGRVEVTRYWLVSDVGIVINPRQLRLNLEGGSIMGISQALHEELQFNSSSITSTSFKTYPILTMAEMPEITIELISHLDGKAGQGSEPANMLPPVALAGAFFDATGTAIRKLPMRPEYVLAELRDS